MQAGTPSDCPLTMAKLFVLLVNASGRVIYYRPQTAVLKMSAGKLAERKPGEGEDEKSQEQLDAEDIRGCPSGPVACQS